MFIHTNPLNEGRGFQKSENRHPQELSEGENPRAETKSWQGAGNQKHGNCCWQKLRK